MKSKPDSEKNTDSLIGADRRGNPRFRFLHEVRLFSSGRKIIGFSYDISVGGLSFVVEENLSPAHAAISIPVCKLIADGKILDCLPGDRAGFFRCRFEFLKPLEPQIISDILAAAKAAKK